MKSLLTTLFFTLLFFNINAQCTLEMDITIDGSGNIVTTNNSIGAGPIFYWHVYNIDLDPWTMTAEYVASSTTISYSPLYVGNYLVCLNGTVLGNNTECDSICDSLYYSQDMMDTQTITDVYDLWGNDEISIYPVPAQTTLNIIGGDLIHQVEFRVYDMLGKEHHIELNNDGSVNIFDVSVLSSGVYFLKAYNTNTLRETTLRFSVK